MSRFILSSWDIVSALCDSARPGDVVRAANWNALRALATVFLADRSGQQGQMAFAVAAQREKKDTESGIRPLSVMFILPNLTIIQLRIEFGNNGDYELTSPEGYKVSQNGNEIQVAFSGSTYQVPFRISRNGNRNPTIACPTLTVDCLRKLDCAVCKYVDALLVTLKSRVDELQSWENAARESQYPNDVIDKWREVRIRLADALRGIMRAWTPWQSPSAVFEKLYDLLCAINREGNGGTQWCSDEPGRHLHEICKEIYSAIYPPNTWVPCTGCLSSLPDAKNGFIWFTAYRPSEQERSNLAEGAFVVSKMPGDCPPINSLATLVMRVKHAPE